MNRTLLVLLVPLLASASQPAEAQWNVANGIQVSFGGGAAPAVAQDGAGGVIIAWDSGSDIYAQRLDTAGNAMWAPGGVPVCTAANRQGNPVIVADGLGGAVVAWEDDRGASTDIYAQHLDSQGNSPITAPADGVAICTATDDQTLPVIARASAGGGIIAWQDKRDPDETRIYARWITASGSALWTADGNLVSDPVTGDLNLKPDMVEDGSGGVIIAWTHWDQFGDAEIQVSRLDADGSVNSDWSPGGVTLPSVAAITDGPVITTDGAGGAIIAYTNTGDIYALRVSDQGQSLWTPPLDNSTPYGKPICTATGLQGRFTGLRATTRIVSDGAGGAIIAWFDRRSGSSDPDIYARRIVSGGSPVWAADGIFVGSGSLVFEQMDMAQSGATGSIIVWVDDRSATTFPEDIFVQRVTHLGLTTWAAGGFAVCLASGSQYLPAVVPSNSQDVITAWTDGRNENVDIFAQRIDGVHGYWGDVKPKIVTVDDVSVDQGANVAVNWLASDQDQFDLQVITHYSIWRATAALPAPGLSDVLVEIPDIDPDFSGRALRQASPTNDDYFWEWLGNQDAMYFDGYSYTAGTRYDSTSADPAWHYFQVVAHTEDPFVFWESDPDSGYSVDNLAPGAPGALTAQRIGTDVLLEWTPNDPLEPDFLEFAIYRSDLPGVSPDPVHLLTLTADSTYVDSDADPNHAFYYKVAARDIHENEGEPSGETQVDPVTGIVENQATPARLQLLPNLPNPFSATTAIRFGMPEAGSARLEVFDTRGRQVFATDLSLPEGWHEYAFGGRDGTGRRLTSGVYYYRISTTGSTESRSMVLVQ